MGPSLTQDTSMWALNTPRATGRPVARRFWRLAWRSHERRLRWRPSWEIGCPLADIAMPSGAALGMGATPDRVGLDGGARPRRWYDVTSLPSTACWRAA